MTAWLVFTPAALDMGDDLGLYFEKPVHNVCITGFEMDVHEVTNAEYAECVGAGDAPLRPI